MGFKSFFHRKKSKNHQESAATENDSDTSPPPIATRSRTPSFQKLRGHIDELEQVFKKFDVNGDGKISSSELGSILSGLGHAATENELSRMITEFDADGDGFIDLDEFIELNTRGVDNNEVMENLRDAFSVYDLDGNGSISAEELHKVMASLGEECSLQECKNMINCVDSDGDGMIDFEEFKVMMMMGARWDSTLN